MIIWIVYQFYLSQMKEKLPIFSVFALIIALMIALGWSGATAANTWDILAYYGISRLNVISDQIAFGIL
ncbi:hypothetical protein [Acidianus ambivalens]|uniref:hypothetical protein n=1 Tax=Acidianus ambivalens TaxID=2283 RepID=UPI001E351AEE|nr:hypothetical protein [Acidianus ambivalens]